MSGVFFGANAPMNAISNFENNHFSMNMRILHRYLGFFLVGIMAVYAVSGIILIFRDTDYFKQTENLQAQLDPGLAAAELGKALDIRRFKAESEDAEKIYFKDGFYNKQTGLAEYSVKELPFLLDKMTHLHKAKSAEPLFFLNIFFGLALLFFVVSSFWMFLPSSSVFRKGLYFTAGGIVLTLLLLFL